MKLAIGGAQFGMDYGISNTSGATDESEVLSIVNIADKNGIQIFDTAPGYGHSELKLGTALKHHSNPKVVTKTPAISGSSVSDQDICEFDKVFHRSLLRLQQKSVHGLLLHQSADLYKPGAERLINWLIALKDQKLVEKIGVSVYDPNDALFFLNHFPLDLMQVPLNIFDQRFLQAGVLDKLKEKNVEVHSRSCFLQGLLLMNRESIPAVLLKAQVGLDSLRLYLSQLNISVQQACLGFCSGIEKIDHIICGVESAAQLISNIESYGKHLDYSGFSRFAENDPEIINPSLWRR